ncbi:MAG: aminotransferase class V-fold PLP-dependent enzyme [Pseudomonadota bacterium]
MIQDLPPFGAAIRPLWALDSAVKYLNHGAYGATPNGVLQAQEVIRREIEANPARFFADHFGSRLESAVERVAKEFGGQAGNWVFLDNATTAINAVMGSLTLKPGAAVLVTDQTYGAVRKAVAHHCARQGAHVREVTLPCPADSGDQIVEVLAAAIDETVALAVIDAVVSASALVLPLEALAARCRAAGVPLLIDGAHAPGMLGLDAPALGADWVVGNLHKWAFAPRSCGVLWATPARRDVLVPPVISWGFGEGVAAGFHWPGTRDFTPWLAAPAGLDFGDTLGWPALRARNRTLALSQGDEIAAALGTETAGPHELTAAMRAVRLPGSAGATAKDGQALSRRLFQRHRIEVPIKALAGGLWLRISAQAYNEAADYESLITALKIELS